jgi:2-keto-4-pentenoate hydratase/2-oxohepta-3-ene-1,7-dioic acid hydratase in catechol pathway
MIFSVSELICFLSASTTILRGTVILTGTPQGVGMATGRYLLPGDVVKVSESRIGSLTNQVKEELS